MNSAKKNNKDDKSLIALNKKARFEYFIESSYEAGLALEGWEVKSLRAGRAQLTESYVIIKEGEAWLLGAHINPLITASTHVKPDPSRTRKLLLNRRELDSLSWSRRTQRLRLGSLKTVLEKVQSKTRSGFSKR